MEDLKGVMVMGATNRPDMVDPDKLAEITDRPTGVDIAGICMKARLFALREIAEAKKVTMEHFYRTVKEAILSVTEEMKKEYDKLARKVKQESVRIGFKKGE